LELFPIGLLGRWWMERLG